MNQDIADGLPDYKILNGIQEAYLEGQIAASLKSSCGLDSSCNEDCSFDL